MTLTRRLTVINSTAVEMITASLGLEVSLPGLRRPARAPARGQALARRCPQVGRRFYLA